MIRTPQRCLELWAPIPSLATWPTGPSYRRAFANVCRSVEAVAIRPFEQRVQRVNGMVDALVQVAELGEPAWHGGDRAIPRVDVVDLVPGDRRGDGRFRHAAHRVCAGHRVVPGVLVIVDEQHGGIAVLSPPRGRHVARDAALDLSGKGVCGPADLGEPPPRLDADVDVQAVAAGRLRPPGRTQLPEYLVGDVGYPAHRVEPAVWHRIQVDAPLVRTLGVRPAGVPRVELDGRHLDGPQHAGQFGDTQLVGVPAVTRELHPDGLQPRRGAIRNPLLVHLPPTRHTPRHPGREAVHHARPLPQCAHDAVADRQVV